MSKDTCPTCTHGKGFNCPICWTTTITMILPTMPTDMNKAVAENLKAAGMSVKDTQATVTVATEPGRMWIKYAGQTSVTAYG